MIAGIIIGLFRAAPEDVSLSRQLFLDFYMLGWECNYREVQMRDDIILCKCCYQ